jgi:DNA-binding NtrC family response regulator
VARVLIVDDEAGQRTIVASILRAEGHEISEAADVAAALKATVDFVPSVVLTDLRMPGGSGLDLVARVAGAAGGPEIVVMTAYGSVETAVKALKAGAYDYLTKPLERDELLLVVQRADEKFRLRMDGVRVRDSLAGEVLDCLVAESCAMKDTIAVARKVAATEATVLITGESGSGKECIARLVHYLSPRGSKPFLAVNCAALSEGLLDSELFGHEKGAFTGAAGHRTGLVQAAEGGTLFLDEIGDMAPGTQAKILRVLQHREIRLIGSNETVSVDVRFIAATNKDLPAAIRSGAFREDLYYRLNTVPVAMPPLRERVEDIPGLISRFLSRVAPRCRVSDAAMVCLARHSWPGNVRELEAVLTRITILHSKDVITPDLLPREVTAGPVTGCGGVIDITLPPGGINFDDWERTLLRLALERANGVMAEAARLLGMTYRTFQYRAEKFGLSAKE